MHASSRQVADMQLSSTEHHMMDFFFFFSAPSSPHSLPTTHLLLLNFFSDVNVMHAGRQLQLVDSPHLLRISRNYLASANLATFAKQLLFQPVNIHSAVKVESEVE